MGQGLQEMIKGEHSTMKVTEKSLKNVNDLLLVVEVIISKPLFS